MRHAEHPLAEWDRDFWAAADRVRGLFAEHAGPFSFNEIEGKLMPEATFPLRSLHAALLHMLSEHELARTRDMAIVSSHLEQIGA